MSRRRKLRWQVVSLTEVIDRDPVARGLDARLLAIGYTRTIGTSHYRAGPEACDTLMVAYKLRGAPAVSIALKLLAGDLVKR